MQQFDCVIIDYGHGGQDPETGVYVDNHKQYTFQGESVPRFNRGLHIVEGVINRQIAARLIAKLLELEIRVVDAVAELVYFPGEEPPTWEDLEQENETLDNRVRVANAHPDGLFVSLHSNAIGNETSGPGTATGGAIVFTSPGQTQSDPVAETFIEELERFLTRDSDRTVARGDMTDGDRDYESDFHVLMHTEGAAVLVEGLFFTNLGDALFLRSEGGQDLLARAYASAIAQWVRVQPPHPNFGHPAIAHVMRCFELVSGDGVSDTFNSLAHKLADALPPGPEVTVALRDLLRAKESALRAAVIGES